MSLTEALRELGSEIRGPSLEQEGIRLVKIEPPSVEVKEEAEEILRTALKPVPAAPRKSKR
jgi:hypothetical protein